MNARLWLVLLLTALSSGGLGYTQGQHHARQHSERRLAEIHAQHAREETVRHQTALQAERDVRQRMEASAKQVAALTTQLTETTEQLAVQRRSFNRRLAHAAHNARAQCTGLPSDWVRLYNEATGLAPAGSDPEFQTRHPQASADTAPTTAAASSRIQPSEPLTTPEDVLAHIRDYGLYCRTLNAHYNTLAALVTP